MRFEVDNIYDIQEVVQKQRSEFCVEINQPLVLISQIQRSGGTFLSQLLDGHSELYVHPSELYIGRPDKYNWPKLDLTKSPALLFDDLYEKHIIGPHVKYGYEKFSKAERLSDPNYKARRWPFIFDINFQKKLFIQLLEARKICTQRDVLNCYITSYFNAWLDYQDLYRSKGQVKYWASFVPRMIFTDGNFECFARDYSDGKVIMTIRNPVSWYASARRHSHVYTNMEESILTWMRAYRKILNIIRSAPDKVILFNFEDCVANTDDVMKQIADFLNIQFEPVMLRPTFNGMNIESVSSFGAKKGIDKSALDRSQHLSKKEIGYIQAITNDLYVQMRQLANEYLQRRVA